MSGSRHRDVRPSRGRLGRVLPYLPSVAGWRRTTRGHVRLLRARALADRGPLTTYALLVALAAALAVGIPRQLNATVDGGARDAVRAAGPESAVDVGLLARWVDPSDGVSPASPARGRPVTADQLREKADRIVEITPPRLAALLEPMTVGAVSEPMPVRSVQDDGALRDPVPALLARVGWADPRTGGALTWVRGKAPVVPDPPDLRPPVVVPVGVSQAAAAAWGLEPGTRIVASRGQAATTTLLVTGVWTADEPGAAVWRTVESAQRPVPRGQRGTDAPIDEVTFLVDGEALPVAEAGLGAKGLQVHLRRPVDLDAVTGDALRSAAPILRSYDRNRLVPLPSDPQASFASALPGVVDAYLVQARAVVAQLSVATVSVIGVAAVVLLLAAQLLVRRRRTDLALQHARGRSLTAIGLGLLLESLVVAGAALAGGAGLGVLVTPQGRGGPGVWLVVAVVALLLVPMLGMLEARAAWASRTPQANRRTRARGRRELQARRAVAELLVVAVAVAAVVSLRARGLATSTAGVDPLLAAAPLLLTAAVTVVVLRVYPWPVRAAAVLAKRRRGAVALVAAARARTGLSWSPLLALTLSVGLMVGTGVVATTLVAGQESASWERTGADVRADLRGKPVDDAGLARLRARPGVDAACRGLVGEGWTTIGVGTALVRLLAVEPDCYRRVLAASGLGTAAELSRLAAAPGGDVEAVLSGDVRWPSRPVELRVVGGPTIRAVEVGRASVPPSGWLKGSGPVVILDAAALRQAGWTGADTTLWVVGPGAAAAVAAAPDAAEWTVHDRGRWLAEQTADGLIADLGRLLAAVLALLAVLAAIAMVQTVSAGAGERGRAVSLLRTLGLPARAGRRITVAELLPLVLTGVLAGAVAGFALVALLAPSLGLEKVTGGVASPALRLSPRWALAVVAAGVLLVAVAAAVESLLQRTQRLAAVLRVGSER